MAPRIALRGRSTGGFTLIEVAITATLLAIAALLLMATVTTGRQADALSAERSLANNAVRAYIEYVRQTYPTSETATDMSGAGFLTDTLTPIHFLPSRPTSGANPHDVTLIDPQALVLKCTDESGSTWYQAVSSDTIPGTSTVATWAYTDATMATSGTVSMTMSATDKTCLGLPRDLNGNGSSGDGTVSNPVLVPALIAISWQTASSAQLAKGSGATGSGTAQGRQKIVVYAIFSAQH